MLSNRLTRNVARPLGVCRLELLRLEDRLAPGQAGLGSALASSLLGPALASFQLDALASSLTGEAKSVATLKTGSIAVLSKTGAGVESTDTAAPVAATIPLETAPPRMASNSAANQSDLVAAGLAANEAAREASSGVIGLNPAIMAASPLDVPGGIQPTGHSTQSGDSGSRTSLVGPNIQTNNNSTCSSTTGEMQSETAIAHSGGTVVVAYNDSRGLYGCGQVTGWAYSTDRGRTFTQGDPLPGSNHWGDPWLVTAPDGSIYLSELRVVGGSLAGLHFMKGTPTGSGVTWTPPVAMGTSGVSPDKEAMAVDPATGHIYITFTRFSGGSGIWLFKSTDGGASFTGPTVISTGSGTQLQGSAPAIGPNGELYVAWVRNYPNENGIGFAKSTDGGATFTVTTQIATVGDFSVSGTDRTPTFPHIAVDRSGGPNNGNIYIAYHSAHIGGGTNGDAVFMRSTNGGSTWSTPTRINDDGTSALQWFPTMKVDSFGFLHSFFYDRRLNPGTTTTNLYYARSGDGGLTWEPNVRVTDQSFNMTLNGADVSPWWGDYINADVQGKSAMVAYADGRSGNPDAYFTRVGNRD
jgi:hypothetical protein